MSNPQWFRYEWIWRKAKASRFLDARRRPLDEHEQILVFGTEAPTYNPQMVTGQRHRRVAPKGKLTEVYGAFVPQKTVSSDELFPRTVLDFRNAYYDDGKQLHPSQKPVALLEYLIRTYSNPGDVVLDFTMGSGSTGEACINTGRRFIGIEKGADEFDVAHKRLTNAQTPLFTSQPSPVIELEPEQMQLAV